MTNKAQILQTALHLFAQKGYDATPTSLIAKEAGVSEGLIFRHYTNKAGLLEAIIQQGLAQIADTMQAYQTASDPLQAIAEHIEQSFALLRAHEAFWRLVQKIRSQPTVQLVAGEQIKQVNQFIVNQLANNFEKLGAPAPLAEALMLFALIDGITIHYLDAPDTYPLDEMQQLLLKKYTHGNFLG